MICSEKELHISDNHEGIMILDNGEKVGDEFNQFIDNDDEVQRLVDRERNVIALDPAFKADAGADIGH